MENSFTITILHDRRRYRYKVELIKTTTREEIYRLTAKNKTVILTNNRPFLKEKRLKHWHLSWNTDPEIWNTHFLKLIIEAMEKVI